MAEGSVVSSMEFLNYKIVESSLNMKPTPALFLSKPMQYKEDWISGLRFSDVLFDENHDLYFVKFGMRCALKAIEGFPDLPENEFFVEAMADIVGTFRFVNNDSDITNETKDRLLKFQAPAIMAPFLRAALAGLLMHAGYGNIIPPLINVYEAAKGADVSIINMTSAE